MLDSASHSYQKEQRGNGSIGSQFEAFLILEIDRLGINKDGYVLFCLLKKQFSWTTWVRSVCLFVYFYFMRGA